MDDRGRALLAIQAIHEAAIRPDGFSEALTTVLRATRADRALFTTEDPKSCSMKQVIGVGYDSAMLDRFKHFQTQALPGPHLAIPAGQVRRCSDVIANRALKRTAAYSEVIKPSGDATHALLAPSIIRTTNEWATLTLGRHSGTPDFDDHDVETLRVIVPHLSTAWKVSRHLREVNLRAATALAAMDQLPSGVIVVDDLIKPIYMNARAAAWVSSSDGIQVINGSIAALKSDETRLLHRAVASAARLYRADPGDTVLLSHDALKQISISRPERRSPLVARVVPISAGSVDWTPPAAGIAIIFVNESNIPRNFDSHLVKAKYGLSAREMDMLAQLIRGSDLRKTAAILDIGIGTARWHLKHIFEKTNTHRQAELVSLVVGGIPGQDCA